MKHTKLVFIIIALFIFEKNYSQSIYNNQLLKTYEDKIKEREEAKILNLQGSSYIDENYVEAEIFNVEEVAQIRYDAFLDEMDVKTEEGSRYLKKELNTLITFIKEDKVYTVSNYDDVGVTKTGYFVVLVRDDAKKLSLLVQEKIILKEEVKPKTNYDKYKPPTLKRLKDKIFVSLNNNPAMELSIRKKEILNIFSSKSKIVEKFAKENKLNFKKQEDLTKIFSYYNTL